MSDLSGIMANEPKYTGACTFLGVKVMFFTFELYSSNFLRYASVSVHFHLIDRHFRYNLLIFWPEVFSFVISKYCSTVLYSISSQNNGQFYF